MPRTATLLCLCLVACGESHATDAAASVDRCASGETLSFTVELTEQHVEELSGGRRGIDLDGRVSDLEDELGCHQPDYVDPVDGERGVDNGLGSLVRVEPGPDPMVSPGQRLMLELQVDDRTSDACIGVQIDGHEVAHGELADGRFRAFSVSPSFEVAMENDDGSGDRVTLPLRDVALEGSLTAEGAVHTLTLAGRLPIEETVASFLASHPDLDPSLVRTTLEGIADLDPDGDGRCQSVSAAFGAEPVR